jgi:hypothetical protein
LIVCCNFFFCSLSGPEAIAEGFLADKSVKSDERAKLEKLMEEFVSLTEQALQAHEALMSPDMREWQDTAIKRFQSLKTKLMAYFQ